MMLSPFLPPFFSLRPRRFLLLLLLPLFVAGAAVGVAAGAAAAGAAAPAEPQSEPARSTPHQPDASSAPKSCRGNSAPAEPLQLCDREAVHEGRKSPLPNVDSERADSCAGQPTTAGNSSQQNATSAAADGVIPEGAPQFESRKALYSLKAQGWF